MTRSARHKPAKDRFASRGWHTLVADTAQGVKNATAKRSQALFEVDADFRLALSGTPVQNRLAELWSIMRFVNPGLFGSMARVNERFAGPIERNRDREAQHLLKRLVGPFVLRRTKAQVLQDLPPRTELTLAVTPEFAGAGAKVQAFAELAAGLAANGRKTLVFSQFVDFLQLLRAPLEATGLRFQISTGRRRRPAWKKIPQRPGPPVFPCPRRGSRRRNQARARCCRISSSNASILPASSSA